MYVGPKQVTTSKQKIFPWAYHPQIRVIHGEVGELVGILKAWKLGTPDNTTYSHHPPFWLEKAGTDIGPQTLYGNLSHGPRMLCLVIH